MRKKNLCREKVELEGKVRNQEAGRGSGIFAMNGRAFYAGSQKEVLDGL